MKFSHHHTLTLAAAALILIGLTTCKTTTLESVWKEPEVGSIKFTKVLVIGIAPMTTLRVRVEDAMKAEITGVTAVASYKVLPDIEDQVNPEKIAEVVKAENFDGIITMRMIGMNDDVTYHPGGYVPTHYQSFSSYYAPGYALSPFYGGMGGGMYGGMGVPMSYEYIPPSTTRETYTSIETNIYDALDGKLIWYGRTKTKNADERKQTIPEVAAVVRAKLRSQGLIP